MKTMFSTKRLALINLTLLILVVSLDTTYGTFKLPKARIGNCIDTSKFCQQWAKEGKCSTQGYLKKCPKACGVCTDPQVTDDLVNAAERTKFSLVLFMTILFFGGLIAAYKIVNLGEICRSKGNLRGKIVVITGATSGIGLETAFHLASRGARLILGCRNLTKGLRTAKYISDQTGQKLIEVKKLDLSSLRSVRDFAADINEECEQVDILINNAAMISSKKRQLTKDGHEKTFQVNYLSHFLLTNLLLDKLKSSQPSRIINIVDKTYHQGSINFTDLQYKNSFSNKKAYNDSKLALMVYTQELSEVLHKTGVTVNAVYPGACFTYLFKNIFPYNFKILWPFFSCYGYIFWKSASFCAETAYYCALERSLENVTGKYFENCQEKEVCEHKKKVAKQLWEVSEKLVNSDKHYDEVIHKDTCLKSPRNTKPDTNPQKNNEKEKKEQ